MCVIGYPRSLILLVLTLLSVISLGRFFLLLVVFLGLDEVFDKLCLLLANVLVLKHIKDVSFILGALQLLDEGVVAHLSLSCLSALLDLFLGEGLLFNSILSGSASLCGSLLCHLGQSLPLALLNEELSELRVNFGLIRAYGPIDDLFLFLILNRHLEVHVELLLRGDHDLVSLRQQFLKDVMSKALTLKGLPELLPTVLAESNGLVAARRLDVLFSEHVTRLLEVLRVRLQGRVDLLNLLVEKGHLQIDRSDFRVVLANTRLKNA